MTTPIFQPVKGALQQWTVQYVVTGNLDGDALAPSAQEFGVPNEEGTILVPTGNLGIIDPDLLGGRATMGDRFVNFIRIETAIPMPVGFAMSVVDATRPAQIVETRRITPPTVVGTTSYISTECVYVPQGQALRLSSMVRPVQGQFHRITIGVRAAVTGDDEARLASACCCQSEAETGGAQPEPPPEELAVRQVYDFSHMSIVLDSDLDTYLRFSAGAVGTPETTLLNESNMPQNEVIPGPVPITNSATKLALRAGSVTLFAIRSSAPITVRFFVDVSVGAGAFVRTFAMAASQLLVANTTTVITPSMIATFAAGTRYRVGFTIDEASASTELSISVEITDDP